MQPLSKLYKEATDPKDCDPCLTCSSIVRMCRVTAEWYFLHPPPHPPLDVLRVTGGFSPLVPIISLTVPLTRGRGEGEEGGGGGEIIFFSFIFAAGANSYCCIIDNRVSSEV